MKPTIHCAHTRVLSTEELKKKMHPANENKHSKKQIEVLAKIITKNGQRSPIVVSKRSGYISKGHGRLQAMILAGYTEAAVDDQDYSSDLDELNDRVADNEIARYAEFNEIQFKENLVQLDVDLESIDFEEFGLIDFSLTDSEDNKKEEGDLPEVQDTSISRLGDVWLLGKHRLMCGSSTDDDMVEKLMAGNLADQLVTDPPYNVAYEGKTKDALKIQNDSMSDEKFREFLSKAFILANKNLKPGAVFYVWHADSEGFNFRGACRDVGWKVRQCLIWKKNTIVMGRQDYQWKHEPCLYGWKDGAGHLWATDRKQTTILEFDKPARNDVHPTMKPIELIEYQILNNTKGGDIVLDLFLGSGTTLIAAERNGRRCFGMELDPRYCDVIIRRFEAFAEEKATLEATGKTFEEVKTQRAQ